MSEEATPIELRGLPGSVPKPELKEITTERLRLRRYREDDFDNAYRLTSDPRVMRYYPATYDRDRVARMIDNILRSYDEIGYSVLAVERLSDGAYLGQIGLLHWDDVDAREDVEVAYMLAAEAWGNGYATEAARACRDWAFEHLGVDRVVSFAYQTPRREPARHSDLRVLDRSYRVGIASSP